MSGAILPSDLQYTLPSDELIDSDNLPLDNQEQNFISNVLLFLLEYVWKHRDDWFWGVDVLDLLQKVLLQEVGKRLKVKGKRNI